MQPRMAAARRRVWFTTRAEAASSATTTTRAFGAGPVSAATTLTRRESTAPIFYSGGVSSSGWLSTYTKGTTKAMAAACAAAVVLCGCASLAKPQGGRGAAVNPSTGPPNYLACLRANRLPVSERGSNKLQVGALPSGPTIVFEPTAGIAEGQQIKGKAQGAEVIGAALLYPNHAQSAELTVIENCLGQGVKEPKE